MILPILLFALLVARPAPCADPPMCSCAIPPVEAALEKAEVAFAGVVTGEPDPAGEDRYRESAVFQVTRRFKGAAGDSITIYDDGSCAVVFRPGEEYLILATRRYDGVLYTTFCHRSRTAAQAEDDLRGLAALPRGEP
jgi:hypothetical protein